MPNGHFLMGGRERGVICESSKERENWMTSYVKFVVAPGKCPMFKDPVLSIMHCALQKSAAIFLMLETPVGLIALCNHLHLPCQSLNVIHVPYF